MDRSDSRTRRVLHVVERMDRGGVETLLMNVYRQIDRDKTQFDFAVHADRPAHYDDEIVSLGGQIFRHPKPCEAGFWKYGKALCSTLRRHGPFTAVHSHVHYFSGFVLLVAQQAGVSVRVAHSHTTSDGHESSLSRQAYRWIMRRLIDRYATHLAANSQTTYRALYGRDLGSNPRSAIIRLGLDCREYTRLAADRLTARRQLGLPTDGPLVGHVGGFRAVKNHSFLLGVFQDLLCRLPSARLILVGDGPLRPDIEAEMQRRGLGSRVRILGAREDVPQILAALDVLLLPSIYEGLPNVLIEAQAAGVPCVVSSSVTREADLKLGLVRFVDLAIGLDTWATAVAKAADQVRPPWETRWSALRGQGYGIETAIVKLEQLYGGTLS